MKTLISLILLAGIVTFVIYAIVFSAAAIYRSLKTAFEIIRKEKE